MDFTVPLKGTNKAALGVKLLSATISSRQVNRGYFYTSMSGQWLLFCSGSITTIMCEDGSYKTMVG